MLSFEVKLQLDDNDISGTLPSAIGELYTLGTPYTTQKCFIFILVAFANILIPIPSSLSPGFIEHMDFKNNLLSGSIPTEMGRMTALSKFQIRSSTDRIHLVE